MNEFDETIELDERTERRFEEVFAPSDRLQLTHDWQRALHDAIAAEHLNDPDAPLAYGAGDSADVINLADERASRRWAPRLLVAAAVLTLAGFGVSTLLADRTTSTGDLRDIPVLSPDREIATPTFRSIELPPNTTNVAPVDLGFAALTEAPGSDETVLYTSNDGIDWVEVSTLQVRRASFSANETSWIVAGQDPASIQPSAQGPFDTIATEGVVWRSEDLGESWDPLKIEVAQDPRTYVTSVLTDVVAVEYEGTVVAGYNTGTEVDLGAAARDLGKVGPEDRVLLVPGNDGRSIVYAIGPDTIGPIELTADELGWTRNERDDLLLFGGLQFTKLARSSDRGAFEAVDVPGEGHGIVPNLVVGPDGFGLVTFDLPIKYFTSTDGLEWNSIDERAFFDEAFGGSIEISETWSLNQDFSDGVLERKNAGGSAPVPAPGANLVAIGFVETTFGAAVVWGDIEGVVNQLGRARAVDKDGYTIELLINGTFTLTDPTGAALVERQSTDRPPENGVVVDYTGAIYVLGDDGEIEVYFSSDDLYSNLEIDDEQVGVMPRQFVSWSTNGDDWKFASLSNIGSGLWVFLDSDAGLLGIDVLNYNRSVLIEWPSEFADR